MKKILILLILLLCVLALTLNVHAAIIGSKEKGSSGDPKKKELCCDKNKSLTLCSPDGSNPGDFVCLEGEDNYSLPEDLDGDGELECPETHETIDIKNVNDACDYGDLVLEDPKCPDDPDCRTGVQTLKMDITLYCCKVIKKIECDEIKK